MDTTTPTKSAIPNSQHNQTRGSSPRSVMEFPVPEGQDKPSQNPAVSQASPVASPASPSNPLASVDSNNSSSSAFRESRARWSVRKAQVALVRGDHAKALELSNRWIEEVLEDDDYDGPIRYFQTTLGPLKTDFCWGDDERRKLAIRIRLGNQTTPVDEMAAVGLQAWHALCTKSLRNGTGEAAEREAWYHLDPILRFYTEHPMPLQLFGTVWIPFWKAFPMCLPANALGDRPAAAPELARRWTIEARELLQAKGLLSHHEAQLPPPEEGDYHSPAGGTSHGAPAPLPPLPGPLSGNLFGWKDLLARGRAVLDASLQRIRAQDAAMGDSNGLRRALVEGWKSDQLKRSVKLFSVASIAVLALRYYYHRGSSGRPTAFSRQKLALWWSLLERLEESIRAALGSAVGLPDRRVARSRET